MPELWIPGATGPSVEDFVARLHKSIEEFVARRDLPQASVEVQLHDGTTLPLHSIRPEPGYGFVTLCPYPDDQERPWPKGDAGQECPPEELIVPIGSIVRITLGAHEDPHPRFGFSVPAEN
jgi:hypothetical protein